MSLGAEVALKLAKAFHSFTYQRSSCLPILPSLESSKLKDLSQQTYSLLLCNTTNILNIISRIFQASFHLSLSISFPSFIIYSLPSLLYSCFKRKAYHYGFPCEPLWHLHVTFICYNFRLLRLDPGPIWSPKHTFHQPPAPAPCWSSPNQIELPQIWPCVFLKVSKMFLRLSA